MKSEFKARFEEARNLKDSGDNEAAREILMQLHQIDSSSASVLAVLADVCWDLEYFEEAVLYFKHAIALKPNSESVSLGLFHCLWEMGCADEAFDEMRRFLSGNESKEYRRILTDINQE